MKRFSLLFVLTLTALFLCPSMSFAQWEETPTVYFTSDISPEGLMSVYEALDWEPTGNVAVKISTGE